MQQIYSKLVVKIGTNVLTRADGSLDITNISHLVDQLALLKKQGVQLILVSSGAVGAGRELLPDANQLDSVARRQMLSAIGQVRLMELYRQLFGGHQLLCGQILATKEDFRDRQHYLNMRNCLEAMLHERVVPILNENDAVAITELMFTDNDELASLLSAMLNADGLVILSSVDGLFAGSPNDPAAQLIRDVGADDESVLQYIAPIKSSFGRGGMETKLRMAQQTARLGTDVILANGRRPNILLDILAQTAPCTRIKASTGVSNVKKWLAHQPDAKGKVYVNAGAKAALLNTHISSSLLPIGIIRLEGDFQKGDLLRIMGPHEEPIGLGVAQYSAEEAAGKIGEKGHKALVHYDYLVLF